MNTYSAKPADIERKWYVIDAQDVVLGRLAVKAARLLKGKDKVYYSPNLDCGDHVVIINAEKVHLTGNKVEDKKYFWHTGYPGGVKERTAKDYITGRFPERVLEKAVQRMLPRSPLGRKQLTKLHVYAGAEHPHTAQQPEVIEFAAANRKNKKGSE